eukprot:SM000001S04426  [mRNA]  locus=s1:171097:176019:+ [translate_table: standard]
MAAKGPPPPPPPPVSAEAAAPAAPAVRIYAPRGGVLPAFWRGLPVAFFQNPNPCCGPGLTAAPLRRASSPSGRGRHGGADKHEHDAARNWDLFYRRNAANFFKDRHYLHHEWGQYLLAAEVGGDSTAPGLVILEACPTKPQDHKQKLLLMLPSRRLELGCGAGNTVYPLLAANKEAFVYATDFSPRAVELVKAHAEYSGRRIKTFVSDISVDDLVENVPAASIFVLSAISPTKMHAVLCNIAKVLKPGGRVLLRDYAAGDLAQERLMAKEQKISDNFFARGDGTLVYYFTEAYLRDLFSTAAFECEHMKIHSREIANRARQLVMSRRWIQGTFALRTNFSAQSGFALAASGSEASTVKILLGCMSTSMCKTARSSLIWDSSKALAELLAARPQLFADKAVLELGCGAAALPSLVAAAGGARVVVATDGDPSILVLLEENIRANNMRQKVLYQQLQGGDAKDVLQTKEVNGGEPFDVVFGSDGMYIKEAVPLMVETASALLPQPQDSRNAGYLLLCHMKRRVSESEILEAAQAYGFQLLQEDPSLTLSVEGNGAADSVASLSTLSETWQSGPLRILPFMRRTQIADDS